LYLLLYTSFSSFGPHIVWSTFLSNTRSWFYSLLVNIHVSLPYSRIGRIKGL
jgi:hypothetical protein